MLVLNMIPALIVYLIVYLAGQLHERCCRMQPHVPVIRIGFRFCEISGVLVRNIVLTFIL